MDNVKDNYKLVNFSIACEVLIIIAFFTSRTIIFFFFL